MTTISHHAHEHEFYTVYALIDPRDYTIRYIGITNDVYDRFAQHLRPDGTNPEKDAWIAELRAANVMLIMKTLETVGTVEQARERETHWIHHHRFLGTHLYNLQVPTIRIASSVRQPKLFTYRKTGSHYGRKSNYEKVKEIILYRYEHGTWPDEVSSEMRRKYEQNYFTKPTRSEQEKYPEKHKQHVRSYKRGREWIEEYKASSGAV